MFFHLIIVSKFKMPPIAHTLRGCNATYELTFEVMGIIYVITLALGSRQRQGFAKVRAKIEPGSHISCSQECKRV